MTPLIDPFARPISYLRVSVTDRCDFRCTYCMAEHMQFLPKKDLLTLEELDRLCSTFIRLGVQKLRITGGEPLVRRDIMTFFRTISRHLDSGALKELTLTTNGSQLAKYAGDLAACGIRRVNVSLDTLDPAKFSKDADYFHICTNNTIYGTKFATLPDIGDVPLVADMSSNILSEPIDVKKFGLIFAGAQKNIGPAGLTLVIVRDDLVGRAPEGTATLLDYKNHVENDSMCNTPPCFAIYMAGLVFDWIKKQGGLTEMQRRNQEKAQLLYDFLDESSLFDSPVKKEYRSLMNVPFITGNEELDEKFIREAGDANLTTLKGHRTVGGMRASIYNAMPKAGVEALIDFMKAFEEQEAANV